MRSDTLFTHLLTSLWGVLADTAPFLLLGFVAAGLFRALIPEQQIYRLLGRERFRSVLLASLIGVPLPLCSCSVIPAAAALRERGAGRGATTSFLISTPETGIDSISITWALMDPIMTVARPLAAFVTALITGAAVNGLGEPAEPAPAPAGLTGCGCCNDDAVSGPDAGVAIRPTLRGRIDAALDGIRYAFGPLLDDLAPWLVVGFVLAAAIAALVPGGTLTQIPSGWVSALLMTVIATPLYVCAAAATPIAAALVAKGLDPGAALVLLLVGPATNVTTMLVIVRLMGRKVLAVYLTGVVASALAFGYAINAVYATLGIELATEIVGGADTEPALLQAVAAVFLIVVLAVSLWRRASSREAAGREARASSMLR